MISSEPLVTIGIPFFDEEEYLAAAIRSVLRQTWTRIEVILVDDGSTDRSIEIARSFRDERVQVFADGRRRFLPARLNEIVTRARGELIARMDADDIAHPDRLRRQVEALQTCGSECVASGTWAGLIDVDEAPFAVLEADARASPAVALERGIMTHASLVARRSWLEANPYDEALTRAEDRDLWCRTSSARFAIVEEPLYVVRVSPRDPTFLPDYLESQRQNRILYARYGARALGRLRTSRRWAESVAKGWLMRGAVTLGVADSLVRRRGRPPNARERTLVLEALEAVRQRP
ncbi:MAG TPA: glycosyltransferase family 2 protein [Labilithrix sp.]|nr:glycosyltransferase family 2 protein [Labilithrix sp.]